MQGEPKVLISHRTFLLWQYSHELLVLGLRTEFASLAAGRSPGIAEAFYPDMKCLHSRTLVVLALKRPLDYGEE